MINSQTIVDQSLSHFQGRKFKIWQREINNSAIHLRWFHQEIFGPRSWRNWNRQINPLRISIQLYWRRVKFFRFFCFHLFAEFFIHPSMFTHNINVEREGVATRFSPNRLKFNNFWFGYPSIFVWAVQLVATERAAHKFSFFISSRFEDFSDFFGQRETFFDVKMFYEFSIFGKFVT